MSKFWVAGATGFLGSHLLTTLVGRGHSVVAVSKSGGQVNGVQVAPVDILDEAAVTASARGADGAFLVTGRVSRDRDDAELLHRDNVLGTETALRALRAAGIKRVVVASTSGTLAVSRDADQVADETCRAPLEVIARWPYYRTKLYAERAALDANAPEFEVVVVNPSLLLGPGDLRESSTGDVRLFLERSIPAIPAGGMAFVDARDAALGLLQAFERGRAGERYLLNGKNMTIAAFFQRLERISGVKGPMLRMPSSRPVALGLNQIFTKAVEAIGGRAPVDAVSVEMAQYFWYCSADKAERELGFVARDPGETIRDTIDDLVKRKVVAVSKGSHLGAFATR
ncbi:MAG TPA: NAD-dependent epimerase/dehydratase family protein [Polyangiaceae bacterium]|nr:NAD-dependent epimerase/dehydratase family protein [Polyangiaceae bacterium]